MESKDRLSKLPESVSTEVLSYLPTKSAIQTSTLAKSWRKLWRCVQAIDFDHGRDNPHHANDAINESYRDLITNALERRCQDSKILRFKLHLDVHCNTDLVDKWVRIAVARGVEELDLFLPYGTNYVVPLELCDLKVLKLHGVGLNLEALMKFCDLTVLHLRRVQGDHREICTVLSACKKLEELWVEDCQVNYQFDISSFNLKSLELHCNDLNYPKVINLEAPSLRHLFVTNMSNDVSEKSKLVLNNCRAIRVLSVQGLFAPDQWFEVLIDQARFLQYLIITNCSGFQQMRVSFPFLRRLAFLSEGQIKSKTLIIDAPELIYFRIVSTSFFRMNGNFPNLHEAEIEMLDSPPDFDYEWFTSFIDLLSNFGHCEVVRLFSSSAKVFSVPSYPALSNAKELYLTVEEMPGTTDGERLYESLRKLAPNAKPTLIVKKWEI